MILMDEKALRKRVDSLYRAMKQRAQPRFWKNGKRRGMIRVPGIETLPFTREQLWQHLLAQVGTGASRCPYCEAIGRPANIITLANCVIDHVVPITRGGTWELSNLRACCADCNRLKGEFSYPFFVALIAAIEVYPDLSDRTAALSCLRGQGIVPSLRRQERAAHAGSRQHGIPPPASPPMLALQDDF